LRYPSDFYAYNRNTVAHSLWLLDYYKLGIHTSRCAQLTKEREWQAGGRQEHNGPSFTMNFHTLRLEGRTRAAQLSNDGTDDRVFDPQWW
jgi:hypothetical protein